MVTLAFPGNSCSVTPSLITDGRKAASEGSKKRLKDSFLVSGGLSEKGGEGKSAFFAGGMSHRATGGVGRAENMFRKTRHISTLAF